MSKPAFWFLHIYMPNWAGFFNRTKHAKVILLMTNTLDTKYIKQIRYLL